MKIFEDILEKKRKEREHWNGGNSLVLGGSSFLLHIAMLEIHYSLNVALNLDLNSNRAIIQFT